MTTHKTAACLICGKCTLRAVDGFDTLPRITSDCRPYSAGGELFVCTNCGGVQKIASKRWLEEIGQIYEDYAAYSLAGGEEQLVLDAAMGQPRKRSDVIMRELHRTGLMPVCCKAIDIGCGHGVTLKAMNATFSEWQLFGHELGEENVVTLRAIPGFHRLYTGDLAQIDEEFDFVSMIHSLEHFVDPLAALKALRHKMQRRAHLFVQVCNVEENPFDLLVADHLTHFSPATLVAITESAGFHVVSMSTDWVKKELSLLAVPKASTDGEVKSDNHGLQKALTTIQEKVLWLRAMILQAEASRREGVLFGLFGTSIAATWLASVLGDRVDFFVDEDPNRIEKLYMGRKVLGPTCVPRGAVVFMPLAPALAVGIRDRLIGTISNLVAPLS